MVYLTNNLSVQSFFESNPLYTDTRWRNIFNAILESGVRFTEASKVKWLAGYSNVPMTIKSNPVKEHFYWMHDLFHQIFPVQCTGDYEESDRVAFKKSSMVGEVFTLYVTEFMYAEELFERKPEWRSDIEDRKSLPLLGFLRSIGKSKPKDVLDILDNLLYGEEFYTELKGNEAVGAWVKHYWPMLEADRHYLDTNWNLLKSAKWQPHIKTRYPDHLDNKTLSYHFYDKFMEIFDGSSKPLDTRKRTTKMYARLRNHLNIHGWDG